MKRASAALLAGLAFGCAGHDDGAHPTGPGTPSPTHPIEATALLSEAINTVAFVSWSPGIAGESWVEYGLEGGALDFSTPRVPTGEAPHEQILLGLKADHTYQWRAVTEGDGTRLESPVGTLTTGSPPPGIGTLTITVSDVARMDPAPWLLTVMLSADYPATVVIFDREGDPVWYSESPSTVRKMHTARPGWDGKSIVYGYYDQNQDKELGGIYRVSMDGRSGSFSSTLEADHDFVERRDGTFAYLHLDTRPDLDVEGDIVEVATNAIYETGEGDDPAIDPPTEIYNQFDDSGQALYWTCSHMQETSEAEPAHQWTHANSLMPDPVDPDNFYWVNYRWQDALLRINRTTHAIDWQIGGRYDDSDLAPDDAFDHGHMSHFWPGGFLMFDNNTHDEGSSRVREYAYDRDAKHVALVHDWEGKKKTAGMADARLTNSDTMIVNWVAEDLIQERNYDDEVVWEAQIAGVTAGRLNLLSSLYDLDDPYPF